MDPNNNIIQIFDSSKNNNKIKGTNHYLNRLALWNKISIKQKESN